MRFLQSILQDAHRPIVTGRDDNTGQASIRRTSSSADASASPAPPLEEQEDGAMTLYRFQKEGAEAGNSQGPRKGVERGAARVNSTRARADIPLPAERKAEHQPIAPDGLTAAVDFSDESSATKVEGETGLNEAATATGSNLIASEKLSTDVFPSIGNQYDLTNETRMMASPYYIASDVPARRTPGTTPPSESYLGVSPQEAEDTPTQGPTQSPMPATGAQGENRARSERDSTLQAIEPTEAYSREPSVHSERVAGGAENGEPNRLPPEPAPAQPPKVHIGQVEVVVVKEKKEATPKSGNKTSSSRHLLSRNYLRSL